MKGRLRVGLLWHAFGHANLGVDALARANAALIRDAGRLAGLQVSFVTLGTVGDPGTRLPPDVKAGPHPSIKQAVVGRSALLAEIRACDIVFDIGGGDGFTDLYGWRRFAFQVATKTAVLSAGVPLVLSPQTIGPFAAPHHRAIAAWILRRATAVQVRDGLSAEFAASLGANPVEFTDVAFALPFEQAAKAQPRRVAINVSGLLWNGAIRTQLDYRGLMTALLDEVAGYEPWFVAHVNGVQGNDTDQVVADDLALRYKQARRAPTFRDAEAAKSFLSGMDLVIAARMHATIAAFSAGVPVVPIAYSRKVNGLFQSLDYPHFVDGQSDDAATALATIRAALRRPDILIERMAPGRELARRRLDAYREEVARLLAGVAARRQGRAYEAA